MDLDSLRQKFGENWEKIRETSQDTLVAKGYIFVPVFGWVSPNEADWIQKECRNVGIRTDITELEAIPAYRKIRQSGSRRAGTFEEVGNTEITVIHPFVEKFWEQRRAKELKFQSYEEQE